MRFVNAPGGFAWIPWRVEHSLAPAAEPARQPEPQPEPEPEPEEVPLPTYDEFMQEQDDVLPAYNDIFSPRGEFDHFQHPCLAPCFFDCVFNTRVPREFCHFQHPCLARCSECVFNTRAPRSFDILIANLSLASCYFQRRLAAEGETLLFSSTARARRTTRTTMRTRGPCPASLRRPDLRRPRCSLAGGEATSDATTEITFYNSLSDSLSLE